MYPHNYIIVNLQLTKHIYTPTVITDMMDRLTLVKRLESSSIPVFTPSQISTISDQTIESARVLLSRLAHEGTMVRVKRGHYCLPSSNILSVASGIYSPSYVSLWAAFEYHGTTTQSPRIIDVINTHRSGTWELSLETGRYRLRFIKTRGSLLYGMDKVYMDGKTAFIARKEKAVVDGLLFNDYIPLGEVVEAIKDGIDGKQAMEYARRCGKHVVIKRLGYLLSQEGIELDPMELSETYVPLDPSFPRRGTYDPKWRVIDNTAGVKSIKNTGGNHE